MIRNIINEKNKSPKSDKNFYINLGIIGVMFIVSIVFLGKLPREIPIMHDGPKQIYVDSTLGIFLIPIISLVTNILFKIQNRLYSFYKYIYILILIGSTYYYYSLL